MDEQADHALRARRDAHPFPGEGRTGTDPLEVARRARRTGARAAAPAAGPEWTRGAPLPVPPPPGLAAPADVLRRAGVGDPPTAPGTDRPGDGGDEEKPR